MNNFFINGLFHINNGKYVMRFICELDYNFEINIYGDITKTQLITHQKVNKSENKFKLLNIEIEHFNESIEYKRYYYNIKNLEKNNIEYNGSFPLISKKYNNKLNIIFLSCNDNTEISEEWNTYQDRIPSKLWKQIGESSHDIVIHMGDQIYADSIGQLWMDNKINEEQVKQYLHKLYTNTYSEKEQSNVMRNVLNFNIFDDHDIKDCYGSYTIENDLDNKKFSIYKNIAMEYIKKYQLSLVNIYFNDNKDYSYVVEIGKYKFILIDMRTQFYYTKQIFSDKIINWTKNILKTSTHKYNYIILPRPIGGTGKFYSLITSLYLKDAYDEPIHPHNIEQTRKFIKMLFKCKINTNMNIKILAGDAHECYNKSLTFKNKNKKYKIMQYIASAITRSCRANDSNLLATTLIKLSDNINTLSLEGIGKKENQSRNNNYGEIINEKINFYNIIEKNIEKKIN